MRQAMILLGSHSMLSQKVCDPFKSNGFKLTCYISTFFLSGIHYDKKGQKKGETNLA